MGRWWLILVCTAGCAPLPHYVGSPTGTSHAPTQSTSDAGMGEVIANVARIVVGEGPLAESPSAASGEGAASDGPGATLGPPHALDLAELWALAQQHSPELREAFADVEAARGQAVQAGAYPNPRLNYTEDVLGSRTAPQGNISMALHQEIVTVGKRRLDKAIGGRGVDAAGIALQAKRLEVLTHLRKGYYDYRNLLAAAQVNEEAVAALEEGLRLTKQLVEKAKTRPQTDVIALEALMEEAKINLAKTRAAVDAGWKQLAAETGLPLLAPPTETAGVGAVPAWTAADVVGRAVSINTSLRQARLEADTAQLVLVRARREAVPNITVGGGYTIDNLEHTAGGMVAVELPIPVWDRKQGRVREAQARLARAQAAVATAENKLQSQVAEAFGRYTAAGQQVERLETIVPRLQKRLDLLRQAYKAGAEKVVGFSDLLQAEQALLATRSTLAEARRSLWQAVADLEGLMQIDLDEPICDNFQPK